MKHVVQFSGGAGSWAAAKRVAYQHGSDNLVLLFADTLMEDEDLYRFLDEAAANIGGELVKIAEGRDPWQVFFDKRYLGNTRVDPCSRILKREYLRTWLDNHCNPDETVVYLGIDWSEQHRYEAAKTRWLPYQLEAPLCQEPYLSKDEILKALQLLGVRPPRLYDLGFPHNNCGGFCIKAGQAHFALLLQKLPQRYAYHEHREQELRAYLDKDVAILRDRRNGKTRPLTLKEYRESLEGPTPIFESDEWGGCGCVA